MLGRILMAVVAVCVAGVLAAQLYAQDRLDDAQLQVFLAGERPLPAASRQDVLADLEAAEAWRPGTEALLAQAVARFRAGEMRQAQRLASDAVQREPDNFATHAAQAATLAGSDPAAARRARARSRELNPPVGP